jgi:hypothetical protein
VSNEDREDILRRTGYRIISALGRKDAEFIDLVVHEVSMVVIGHGSSCRDRYNLIASFRKRDRRVTIICLLKRDEKHFQDSDLNFPTDDPPLWERNVIQAACCLQ